MAGAALGTGAGPLRDGRARMPSGSIRVKPLGPKGIELLQKEYDMLGSLYVGSAQLASQIASASGGNDGTGISPGGRSRRAR